MGESDKLDATANEDPVKETSRLGPRSSARGRRSPAGQAGAAEAPPLREQPAVRQVADTETGSEAQSEPLTEEPQAEPAIADEAASGMVSDPEASVIEAAVTPEFEILEELEKEGLEALEELSEEGLQTAELAAKSLRESFWRFGAETANYTKESLDCGSAYLSELLRAKSLPAAFQIRIDYAKSSYVRLLNHLLKMNGLYWSLVEETSKSACKRLAGA